MQFLAPRSRSYLLFDLLILSVVLPLSARPPTPVKRLSYPDLQRLQTVGDVQMSPDGESVAYSVRSINIARDSYDQTFWVLRLLGAGTPVALPHVEQASWSPDGKALAVVQNSAGKAVIQLLQSDTLAVVRSFDLPASPGTLVWSPDSKSLALTLMISEGKTPSSFLQQAVEQAEAELEKPADAQWAGPVEITQAAQYREDGRGWLKQEADHRHIFVLSTTDGVLHRVGNEPFSDSEPAWSADSQSLYFTSDRRAGWEHLYPVPAIYRTDMTGHVARLTQGGDFFNAPKPSPDGTWIAYMRTPYRQASYTPGKLFVMHPDGTQCHQLAVDLDRDLSSISWAPDAQGIYAKFTDHGVAHVALFSLDGHSRTLASGLDGSFSISRDGAIAYSGASPDRPDELMLVKKSGAVETLTSLNQYLKQRQLGNLLHIKTKSSRDGVEVEGWALLPPGTTGEEKLPAILVLHGGPFGSDGPNWDSERELFASAGYAVIFGNYRGSTSYGAAFSEPANHDFPGVAYDDAISLIDESIRRGFVDPKRLFVTGSSAGAGLTNWITGKTNRFRAAAAEKPPINEMSEALTSDQYLAAFLVYGGAPWTHEKDLWSHSPLSLADAVTTPTLFIVGDQDFRTPLEESLQMYDALQLRGIPVALLKAPGASHGSLRSRPSQSTAVISATLAWFHKYDISQAAEAPSSGVH